MRSSTSRRLDAGPLAMPPESARPRVGAALMSVASWAVFFAWVWGPQPVLAGVSVPTEAYGEGAVEGGDPRVEARLIVDVARVAPGESFRAGVHFSVDPDWHIYWRNPGDAGMATAVEWRSGEARFGELLWPAPEPYSQADGFIVTVGYSDQVTLFVEAQASPSPGEQVTLEAEVDFLACKVDCIPGSVTLRRSVPVGARLAADVEAVRLLDAASASTPKSPEALGLNAEVALSQAPVRPGDSFEVALALRCVEARSEVCPFFEVDAAVPAWAFIPDLTPGLKWETQAVKALPGSRAAVALRVGGKASADAMEGPGRFAGLVRLKARGGGVRVVRVEAPVPRGGQGAQITEVMDSPLWTMLSGAGAGGAAPDVSEGPRVAAGSKRESGASATMTLWQALIFGFLGGMLLNLMPCVLPVLAIKVVAFVRMAREDRAEVMRHGLAYTVGVCGSMLCLALVVLSLKAAGTQVGWGFQFQEPVFVAALACVLVLFALNLFGVFEIGVGSGGLEKMADGEHSLRRSAAEGVLAVVLATPCSAPLMGSAVGFALANSPWVVLAVFVSLGLGLALPFVALTLAPGLIERLPRPGPWMMHLKHGLGFVLLGTTVWLLWIVGKLQGVDGLTGLLIWLLGLSSAIWLVSAGSRASKRWLWRGAAIVLLGASGLLGVRFGVLERGGAQSAVVAGEGEGAEGAWRSYSEGAVAQVLAEGRPAFVNFTADWCITCKVNEGTVLTREGVLNAANKHRVVMFKGDWTRRDELIREVLARHGKAGVPMYLMYSPAAPDSPQVLPELLTEALLVEAMASAAR